MSMESADPKDKYSESEHKPKHAVKKKGSKLKNKIFSIPGLVASTVLTAAIGWAVNYGATHISASGRPPVSVSLMMNSARTPFFSDYAQEGVIPAGRDTGTPGGGCLGFYPWLVRNGGVSVDAQFQIVVQSNTPEAVLISDMHAKVLKKTPGLNGSNVACPSAGAVKFRPISINLDASPPSVVYKKGKQSAPFGFSLKDGETEVFDVAAYSDTSYCMYDIVLDLLVGGNRQEVEVSDNGHPFEVTAPVEARGTWRWNYENAWQFYVGSNLRLQLLAGQPFPHGT